jgi:hypothetical protein
MDNHEQFAIELKERFKKLLEDHTIVQTNVLAAECAILAMDILKEHMQPIYREILKANEELSKIEKTSTEN